jgi:hypothetical protein
MDGGLSANAGRTDLAWVSADRGRQAAAMLGDPAWTAAAAFECAHARPSVNKPRALMSAPRIADEFEPQIGDDTFSREIYGMLRLSAALACAVEGDHQGAADHGAEAARIAKPLGDRPDAFELFEPANVPATTSDRWRAIVPLGVVRPADGIQRGDAAGRRPGHRAHVAARAPATGV